MSPRITTEEKSRREAEREAKRKAERDAYIQEVLAEWPPLTDEQIWTIRKLMDLDLPQGGPRKPTAYEVEQRRQDSERAQALRKAQKAALALTACDVCNLQPDEHQYANRFKIDAHQWTPGRAERIMGAQDG